MSHIRNVLLTIALALSTSPAISSEQPTLAKQYAGRSDAGDNANPQDAKRPGIEQYTPKRTGFRGSVVIPVSHTAQSERWTTLLAERAERYFREDCTGDICDSALRKQFAATVREARSIPHDAKMRTINSSVNHAIRYVPDQRLYGRSDHWATAAETMARGAGDCEDQAILKMWMLRAAGVSASDMEILLVRDKARGVDHAVLAVNVDGTLWVMDNTRDQVLRDVNNASYMPLLSLSADGVWIHGQRPHSPQNRTSVARR